MKNTNPEYDLIIIGAGINGAGIARDAAMRGLKVLLVDKSDIGGGTSAWSTRLIHGGLRYLEHGEFGLVRESLRERETLLKIAPHLVRPLPIMLPIYKSARRGSWTIRAGMWAYDLLSVGKRLPRHHFLSRRQALEEVPTLAAHGLEGAAVYYDAQVEYAERLVLENVLSAMEHGASIYTYTGATKFITTTGSISGVQLVNEITGAEHTATARMFINAAGPWVDQVLNMGATSERLIGGTKGSHIVVGQFASAPQTAMYVEAEADGRPFFIIPWNEKYLIGTTDIRFNGNPDDVHIEETEIDYLLRETNRVLPQAQLSREQILYSYSGVRPLPFTNRHNEESITRRHFMRRHPSLKNLLSIVGGKLTTYRSLAEQTTNLVFKDLGEATPQCATAHTPLPGHALGGASPLTRDISQPEFLSRSQKDRLLCVYGDRAGQVMKLVDDNPVLAQPFDRETGAVAAEIVFSFEHELAQTLSDCLMRRTLVALNSSCGLSAVAAAADVGRQYLGWTNDRCAREIEDYKKTVKENLQKHLGSRAVVHASKL